MSDEAEQQHPKKPHKLHGSGHHDDHHGGGGHEEAHEGAPEWLISFADNVALMMGFFVILLAMNMSPKGKAEASSTPPGDPTHALTGGPDMTDFAIALREAFNNPVNIDNPRPQDAELVKRIIERGRLLDVVDHAPQGKDREVSAVRPSDYHRTSAAVLFGDYSTSLRPESRETITQTANFLRGMSNIVEIVGHTSAAESSDDPQRAVKLSFDRAMAVASELAKLGVKWEQLRIIAAGDNDRLVDRAYSTGDQHTNQRVEVTVTEKLYRH